MREFKPGDIIDIVDDIDYSIVVSGTVRLVENDIEVPGLKFLYICANNQELNTVYDPRIGLFWRLIESTSEHIV